MSGQDRSDLPKGSVRSLPHGQMQDIRRMFDSQGEAESSSFGTDYNASSESKMAEDSKARWRTHISPPPQVKRGLSPVRTPRKQTSPNRQPEDSAAPKPTPRKHVDTGHGLSDFPLKQLGNIAGSVALAASEGTPSRVSRVRDQFEGSGCGANNILTPSKDKIKVPLKPKTRSPSPGKRTELSAGQTAVNKSPVALRRNVDSNNDRDNHVYSKIWDKNSGPTKLGTPERETDKRVVSVFERSKMFENVGDNQSSTPSPTKPLKPPPPTRQRSLSGDHSSLVKVDSNGKPLRPRPPFRQRSLVDKTKEESSVSESDLNDNKSKLPSGSKPAPPLKPPRTGAHDDYLKVKLEKEGTVTVVEDDANEKTKTVDKRTSVDFSTRELPELPSSAKKNKPTRPPPPKPKPRPFSIATDSIMDFMSSESSDSDEFNRSREESPFYEKIPAQRHVRDYMQHWDLPRANHPEPTMRRSHSAECIQKAVDDAGNVVYMDPEILRLRDEQKGYDIYVDTEGYAVPNRLVRRNKSIDDSAVSPSKPIGDRFKSKMRRIKNLFVEPDKSSPQKSSSAPDRGSQKKKLDVIRNKVNQAFEVLQSSIRQKNDNLDRPDEENADKLSNDSDSRVDEREIRKRVEYSRSIRIKTNKSIKEASKSQQKVYPQLFEHAMIVSLQQNPDTGIYEPYVIHKFPEIRNYKLTMEGKLFRCEESKDTNVSVPLFCFPDAANYKPSSSAKSQSYNFVLTNFDGGRVYGYCRRFVPQKSQSKMPEVICIISPVDAFSMYNSLLEEIEKKRKESLDAAQELIAASFGRPLPGPGQTEPIRTLDEEGEMETIFVTRDTENRIDNVNVECLLSSLGSDKLLKVFASILMERSVLFCAKNLSTLSSTIHAIISLLYPFSWQHTFIPVLPADMIDVVCSPAPYIIGITATLVQKALTLPIEEHVLIVDIDKRSFVKCQDDEGTLLPKKIEKALKTSLNMCKVDSDAKNSPNLMISEAFLRFFIEAVGHYGQYINTNSDNKKTFQKENFIKGTNSSTLQQLLEWFVETQMFEVFMTKQLEKQDWGNTIEMFQSRVQEHMLQAEQKRRLRLKYSA